MGRPYTLVRSDGQFIVGIARGQRRVVHESSSQWLSFLSVADVDKAAQATAAAGGSVLLAPFDVPRVFTPSYAGAELKLRPMVAVPETTRQPRLFSASTSVLHDVPPRASSLPAAILDAVLKAVLPAELARRAGDALEIKDVPLTDPENARFRIAVDASGHVTQVLPLFASTEPAITSKLRAAIQGLQFKADAKTPVQWATLAFEWQNASR